MNVCNKQFSDKIAISFPCVYPVCPISIDHTRVYVIGDVYARYFRSCGKDVIFPMGFHYSGLTAQKFCSELNSENDNNTKHIFRDVYKCPVPIMNYFKQSPQNILDYYSLKTLQDFKRINLSFDYSEYYTTHCDQYDRFVLAFFDVYKKRDVLKNIGNNIQLNYNDEEWKRQMISWAKNVSTILPHEKKVLMNSIDDLQNGWNILKTEGFGTCWPDNRIIDSMHDSELLSLYDIVNHVSKIEGEFSEEDFKCLFEILGGGSLGTVSSKVSSVLSWMPTSLLVMEEHLKVWFIKKLYAESIMLMPDYRTKKFFVLGMGMRGGKRMSSSRGTAVLLQDLLHQYSPVKTRMILLMVGGHPNKSYNFKEAVFDQVDALLNSFRNYVEFILADAFSIQERYVNMLTKICYKDDVLSMIGGNTELLSLFEKCEKYIIDGYFNQCLTEVMSVIPKKYRRNDDERKEVLAISCYFINILLAAEVLDL